MSERLVREVLGSAGTQEEVLVVENMSVSYPSERGLLRAVQNVSLTISRGQMVGLAGESGSGKSTLVLAATRVLAPPNVVVTGHVRIAGRSVLDLSRRELRQLRWKTFSFVTQSAMNALNPVMRIRDQMFDTMRAHDATFNKRKARERAEEVFRMVELPVAKLDNYPHQLSGGMRQRVVIALAMLMQPELIIMDEPTTALDVVAQREIITLIRRLQSEQGFAVLLITHDLSLLLEITDEIVVLYGGRVMERGLVKDLLTNAQHPYSRALIQSFPPLHGAMHRQEGIPGSPPDLFTPLEGCPFAPRCSSVIDVCRSAMPPLVRHQNSELACHVAGSDMTGGEGRPS